MARILLTRHGHVEGIRPARFRCRAELPLTVRGLAQADALARRIAESWEPVAVFTSPLQRCVVTGGRIAAACGIESEVRDGMGDIDYDAWQMRTHDEVRADALAHALSQGGIAAGCHGADSRRAARDAVAPSRADGGAGRP